MTPDPSDLSFETPRVKARLIREDDLDLYLALYSDPEVMRYVGPVLPPDRIRGLFDKVVASNRREAGSGRYWAITHLRTGAWLGQASLIRDPADASCAEVGIMLLSPGQHRGIGLQVLQALVDMAAEEKVWSGLRALVARHAPGNDGAGRLVAHVGFRRCDSSSDLVCWRLITRREDDRV